MSKNCKLVDHEDNRCIKCTECSYRKDRRNRPWIYEETLNGSPLFPFSNEESEEEIKETQKTLDDF